MKFLINLIGGSHRFFEIFSVILLSLSANLFTSYINEFSICSKLGVCILLLLFSGIIGFFIAGFLNNCHSYALSQYYKSGGASIEERTRNKIESNKYYPIFLIFLMLFPITLIFSIILLYLNFHK